MLSDCPEYSRKSQRVIYLVLKVAPGTSVDPCSSCLSIFRKDLRNRVGKSKYDGLLCHFCGPVPSESLLLGNTNEDVAALDDVLEFSLSVFGVCDLSDLLFEVVHSLLSPLVNSSL